MRRVFNLFIIPTMIYLVSLSQLICQDLNNEFTIDLKWSSPQLYNINNQDVLVPNATDLVIDNYKPKFFWRKKVKSKNFSIQIINIETEPSLSEEKKYLETFYNLISNELELEKKVTNSRNESYAVVDFVPFIKKNGQVLRIKSLKVKLNKTPIPNIQKDFVSSSVLKPGSGLWYKINVTDDGIYKIDKQFLENCGINTSGLNPNSINIYGNGDGLLPVDNSLPRTDDLAKNAIFINGDADGSFDDSDYILFYARGPHRWQVSGAVNFTQQRHHYSDVSCYFININPSEPPLRVASYTPPNSPHTIDVSQFSHRDIHENDSVSLVKGGQRWYGELFDIELERSFSFPISNIVSNSMVQVQLSMASNKRSSDLASLDIDVNGNLVSSFNFNSSGEDFSRINHLFDFSSSSSTINMKLSVSRSNPSTLSYLDRILINARRSLVFNGNQLQFRDLMSVAPNQIARYTIQNLPSNAMVWDVTSLHSPELITGDFQNNSFSFIQYADTIREFVAFNGSSFSEPTFSGVINNQDLHSLDQADYLIVTNSLFLSQANRLAELHRNNGMTVHVVTNEQVYNEFSSGMPDACAIRMFSKMFYDRGELNPSTRPKYLLLFGDGSYDPKNRLSNNTNFVLTYQVESSENHVTAIVTDDFFGMLDDSESISSTDQLDIGIGRLLATDVNSATQLVNKIEHYMNNGSDLYNGSAICCDGNQGNKTFGDWRLKVVQIADDEDNNYFIVNDTEPHYSILKENNREINSTKIYLDAYPQQTTAGGQRYPDVNQAINNCVERGALITHYVGHGGEVGLAQERVVTIPEIQSWRNINAMNLFVSNTCEFTRYDDPGRISAGEWISLNPNGGGIALMTTTRPVFFSVNTETGEAFYNNVFKLDEDSTIMAMGEIIRRTKNESGTQENKRCFTLIGDPALKLAYPRYKVITDSINGSAINLIQDTIKALSLVNVKGHLEDYFGNKLNGFNGFVSPTVYDKTKVEKTLGQDPTSFEVNYEVQKNIIYKGKATVSNGEFKYSFIVPKDISLAYGYGKISHYANNDIHDAMGFDTSIIIGGINTNSLSDSDGPQIEIYLNENSFVNGGITNTTPTLIANVFDSSGINTVGSGIGHDITAIIDNNNSEPIVLNDFYTADLDTYQSGEIRYHFPSLDAGPHQLTFKVWDVNNNSSEVTIDFVVQNDLDVSLDRVYNYPNPFTTSTEFIFEHNQACNEMDVQLQIFTVSGKLVKSIQTNVYTDGYRVNGIYWDGKDDFGDQLAKGVYVYKLKATTIDGRSAEKIEKLVLLK